MMGVYTVEVAVALRRPPRTDALFKYVLEARTGYEAELLAQQWAASRPGVVMPIGSVVTGWPEQEDQHVRDN